MSRGEGSRDALKRALLAVRDMRARVERAESGAAVRHEPIAVVGVGCRFPGGADGPAAFWDLLAEGRDAVGPVPGDRWDRDAYYDPDPDAAGKIYTDRGGFLTSPVDTFDADFFGITPREAAGLDPQQRLLLEVAWESLEHAGIAPDSLSGSRTGVFVGLGTTDYSNLQVRAGDPRVIDTYYGTGVAPCVAAGRIAYVLGLAGPALALDTACSSSLVATALAVESLRSGACRTALAGGVNLMLEPQAMIFLCKFRALSPTGHCHTFDAGADGYVRGEGCGMIVLKRLSDAQADGDRVLGLIRGAAVNHDGRSSGLTVPSGAAQRAVVRQALDDAGLTPGDLDVVEAHGTGTELGDPIELRALDAVFSPERASRLRVGSVKTNLGHLEAAAGVAGLIKLLLSLGHESLPPHRNLSAPTSHVDWDDMALTVPTEATDWSRGDRPRRAGVSAFGFSGTNAHVVVEEAPVAPPAERRARAYQLLTLSARGDAARSALAVADAAALADGAPLADAAHTANVGRARLPDRAAIVAGDSEEARRRLTDVAAADARAGTALGTAADGPPRLVFLFTGQGSQWAGMGRELYRDEPVFRDALDRCDAAFREERGRGLLDVVFAEDEATRALVDQTEFTQPALYALEVALAETLAAWGLVPDAVLGHSVGEYAAAAVAGWFDAAEGLRLIAERARLMQSLPPGGGMSAVLAAAPEVEKLLDGLGTDVGIAALNGPENTVISGDRDTLETIAELFAAEGLRSKPLVVSHAFHSSLMDPILGAFQERAARVRWGDPRVPLYTNRTGRPAAPGELSSAAYWRDHLREPVRFQPGIEALVADGYRTFVELGPHPVLSGMGKRCAPNDDIAWLPTLRRGKPEGRQLLEAVAELWVRGAAFDARAFDAARGLSRIDWPTYPFQRSRHWVALPSAPPAQASTAAAATAGPPSAAATAHGTLIPATPAVQGLDTWSIEFEPVSRPGGEPRDAGWLLLGDATGVGAGVRDALEASGQSCVLLRPADADLSSALSRLPEDRPVEIVYLWSLDMAEGVDSLELLQHAHRESCGGLLGLVQTLDECARRDVRLWVVTRGATRPSSGLTQSPVVGLTATIEAERPDLLRARVDLDRLDGATNAAILFEELRRGGECPVVCYRDGARRVPLWMPFDPCGPSLEVRSDATYLVTGGLGALGRATAGRLIERGAHSLLLVGRRPPGEVAAERLAHWRALGVRVETECLDVADPDAVETLVRRATTTMAPLGGVFHVAGALDDAALGELTIDRFATVAAPKVAGAWNLHQATLDAGLDAFVLFSSAAGWLGAAGQANYAAANAFLDALAIHRHDQGLPAVSIAWGPWSGDGMAAGALAAGHVARTGLRPLEPERALDRLEGLASGGAARVAVLDGDWSRFVEVAATPSVRAQLSRVAAPTATAAAAATPTTPPVPTAPADPVTAAGWRERALAAPAPGRAEVVSAYLRSAIGRIADWDPATVDGSADLMDRGLDSLMVMELVNRVQRDLDLRLFAREVFEHPRLDELAQYLAGELGAAAGTEGDGAAAVEGSPPESATKPGPAPATASGPALDTTERGESADAPSSPSPDAGRPVVPGDAERPSTTLDPDRPRIQARLPHNPPMIFLLSSPRSGSTLLRVMLEGHPDLFCPPELHLLPFDRLAERRQALSTSQLDQGLERALVELTGSPEAAHETLRHWLDEDLTLQETYRRLQERAAPRRLVDKSPSYGESIAWLRHADTLFDEAFWILLVRHPYAMIESFVRNRMARLAGLDEDPTDAGERLWVQTQRNVLRFLDEVPSSRGARVRYEDLVADPPRVAGRLLERLGLDLDERVLNPYDGRRMTDGVREGSLGIGDPNFLQRERIDPELAEVWRTVDLGRPLGEEASELARQLGYDLPRERGRVTVPADVPAGPPATAAPPAPVVAEPREAPLSFAQERLWFVEQLHPDAAVYNMRASCFRLSGALDEAAFRRALDRLVARHESLRTRIDSRDGVPFQVIDPPGPATLEAHDLSAEPAEGRRALALERAQTALERPFDLAGESLFRCVLVRVDENEWVCAFPMHHIVSDGWSIGVIARDLERLYVAERDGSDPALEPLEVRYADHALRERESGAADLETALAWWLDHVGANPPVLQLTSDRPRPAVQSFQGARHFFELDGDVGHAFRALGKRAGATPFMLGLAAFSLMLSRMSGQETVLVGTPIANRRSPGLEGVVGLFANTLALRVDVDAGATFLQLLSRVRDVALGGYEHQELPFARLVEALSPDRSMSHHPLFQAMFTMQHPSMRPPQLDGLTTEPLPTDKGTTQFDVTLFLWEQGNGLAGLFEYDTALFDATTAARFAQRLERLIEEVVADPERPLSGLSMLPQAERAQLAAWNATATESPDTTLTALIEAQVDRTPDAPALRFEGRQLTFRELDERANRLAHALIEAGCGPDRLVGVALERSVELVVALLATLKAGAAYVPLDPDYPTDRLRFMVEDCRAPIVLTHAAARAALEPALGDTPTRLLDLDEAATDLAGRPGSRPAVDIDPRHLAYAIFTSGSTGRPKGAMNEHRGIVNRLHWMQARYGLAADDRVLQKTPFSFDVSVWEFFWPLMTGACLVVARPGGHQEPAYLTGVVDDERITTVHFVPSMLQAFLEEPSVDRCGGLRRVICSGEALPGDLVRRFFQRVDAELHNLYGPTEAAIDVTAWQCSPEDGAAIPIGAPIANTRIHVLDPSGAETPIGVPGELYIGGVQVGRGYLERPELTAERFVADPFSADPDARLYRTGDLARWTPAGVVEFLGRVDFQVKIRGLRIELGEIESVLVDLPDVREAVVVARRDEGETRLVAYAVPHGETPDPSSWRRRLAETLPLYMVPSTIVVLDALPLSPNGKVDRRALPAPTFGTEAAEPDVRPASDGTEDARSTESTEAVPASAEHLRAVEEAWQHVLGAAPEGPVADFFVRGGDSLAAARLVMRLRETTGVDLPLRAVFETPEPARLAARLAATPPATGPRDDPRPVPREADVPTTLAQERLWYLDRLVPGDAALNLPIVLRLGGPLDGDILAAALDRVAARHESLRTRIVSEAGEPRQEIDPDGAWPLECLDLTERPADVRDAEADEAVRREIARGFDLERGPLVRGLLIRLEDEQHLLALTLHHVTADAASLGVLLRELAATYGAAVSRTDPALAPLPLQVADVAVWERERVASGALDADLERRVAHLSAAARPLLLPYDHPRPLRAGLRGARLPWTLPADLMRRLRDVASEHRATPFMTLAAAFSVLLTRYTGQEQLLLGAPVARRNRPGLEPLIGFLANTVVLRMDAGGNPTFGELLDRVRDEAIEACEHEDVPFERLVEALPTARDADGPQASIRVMLVLQQMSSEAPSVPGLDWEVVDSDRGAAQLDLTLILREEPDGGMTGGVEYAADLFDERTIGRMMAHLRSLLDGIAAEPDSRILQLPMLAVEERRRLLDWHETAVEYDPTSLVQQAFERAAADRPHALAVCAAGDSLTYAELDQRSARLAARLRSQGVGADTVVGIQAGRSVDLPVALLAVLRAGGACLLLPPEVAPVHLERLLQDAAARLVITTGERRGSLPDGMQVAETGGPEPGSPEPSREPGAVSHSGDRAWILHDAHRVPEGSDGPLCVALSHRSVVNYLGSLTREPGLAPADTVVAVDAVAPDLALYELLAPLCCGSRVVIATDDEVADGMQLMGLLSSQGATVLPATPPVWQRLLDAGWPGDDRMRLVAVGDVPSREMADALLDRGSELWTTYGHAEATVHSAVDRVEHGDESIRIGRPIANAAHYVLDPTLQPVPPGGIGELWIGGHGVAAGYLGRPRLDQARFRDDPFDDSPGARLFRTGDRVRLRPDGRLEWVGRVEPAAVVPVSSAVEAREDLDAESPGTSTSEPSAPAVAADAPATPLERLLAEVWRDVLGIQHVAASDNFFDLGGHSLLSMKVVARVESATGIRLQPAELIFQSLRQLARTHEGDTTGEPAAAASPAGGPAAAGENVEKRGLNNLFRRVFSRGSGEST